jgi:hypothetical protein
VIDFSDLVGKKVGCLGSSAMRAAGDEVMRNENTVTVVGTMRIHGKRPVDEEEGESAPVYNCPVCVISGNAAQKGRRFESCSLQRRLSGVGRVVLFS